MKSVSLFIKDYCHDFLLRLLRELRVWRDLYGTLVLFLVSSIVCVVSLYSLFLVLYPSPLRVSFLDVGQGDAIHIVTPQKYEVIVDGGPSLSSIRVLGDVRDLFDSEIDIVIPTHGDADHVTGLITVLKELTVQKIIRSHGSSTSPFVTALSEEIVSQKKEVVELSSGDRIVFPDGVALEVLHPPHYFSSPETNDMSLVLLLTYGEHSWLLTGDLSKEYEHGLISRLPQGGLTVYKAGHHGSHTSSGEELLSYTRPEYSVISAGKNNKYGHPHKEVVERLTKYSKNVVSTIDHGTITFVSDGTTLRMVTSK